MYFVLLDVDGVFHQLQSLVDHFLGQHPARHESPAAGAQAIKELDEIVAVGNEGGVVEPIYNGGIVMGDL